MLEQLSTLNEWIAMRDRLAKVILNVIEKIRHDDAILFDGTERCLVARLMLYLEPELHEATRLHEHHLDLEYERHGRQIKQFNGRGPDGEFPRKIVPDLIFHRRDDNSHGSNFLAIEVKMRRTAVEEHDLTKLRLLTGEIPFAYGAKKSPLWTPKPTDILAGRPRERSTVALPRKVDPYLFGAFLRLHRTRDIIQWLGVRPSA